MDLLNAHCIFFCIVFENNKNTVIWVWGPFVCITCQGKRWVHYTTSLQTLHILDMGEKKNQVAIWNEVYQAYATCRLLSDYLLYVGKGIVAA